MPARCCHFEIIPSLWRREPIRQPCRLKGPGWNTDLFWFIPTDCAQYALHCSPTFTHSYTPIVVRLSGETKSWSSTGSNLWLKLWSSVTRRTNNLYITRATPKSQLYISSKILLGYIINAYIIWMKLSCVCLCVLKWRLTPLKRKQNLCEEGTSVLLLQGKSRSISIHQHAFSLFLAPWCPPSSSLANSLLPPPPPPPTLSDFF